MEENRAKLVAEAMGEIQELASGMVDGPEEFDDRLEPKLAGPEYRTNGFFDNEEKLEKEHPEYEWFNLTEEAVVTKAEPGVEELGSFVLAPQVASGSSACVKQPAAESASSQGAALAAEFGLFVPCVEADLATEHQPTATAEKMGSFVLAPQNPCESGTYVESIGSGGGVVPPNGMNQGLPNNNLGSESSPPPGSLA